ncbi:MAG: PP2C family protein-serine/threonine phosphatase [Spirochaetes bacterium]|nr:PP2C family protein-serine/threonine phosphatase [Spirochaetota bacterium]
MDSTDFTLMKKKYRLNYIARIVWSAVMLAFVYYNFGGPLLVFTITHLALSAVWIALVEFESPLILNEDLRYVRIAMDAFLYTLAIYITGGAYSFCLLSYIIFIMLTSLYITNRYGIFAIVACVSFYNAMLLSIHLGYLPPVNILSGEGDVPVKTTRAAMLISNFLLVLVSVIMNRVAHTLYANLMERTEELQTERNHLRNRNEVIENDMRLARRIQEQLIPQASPYPFIRALYRPTEAVGGDFFDFIGFRNSSRLGIFVSDVSGHGVPAAFITSMIKTMILQSGMLREDPAGLLMYLNDFLFGKTADNFITAFYGIYDPDARSMIYSNAGHNLPYLLSANGVGMLEGGRSMPLAIADNTFLRAGASEYRNASLDMQRGDRVIFYTDGLTEERGSDDSPDVFEEPMVTRLLPGVRGFSCGAIVDRIYEGLKEWRGSDRFRDDVCIICMEVD